MGSSKTVIGGEYLVLGKIGEGSFGEVFRATHIATGVDYAIKREPINVAHPQLEHEFRMYEQLAGGVGIPKVHWFGKEGMYNAMVIDLLGPNLKEVRRENEKLPLSFVIELGVQMITQLESIHKKGIVYRDIKPENFLLDTDIVLPDAPASPISPTCLKNGSHGSHENKLSAYSNFVLNYFNDTRRQRQKSLGSDSDCNGSDLSTSPESPIRAIYGKPALSIVDFGLATYYRDACGTGKHIPNRGSTKHKVGTARYASINIHCGREHTRRDDIESVGYMLLEFLIGTLPWSGISARNSRQGWAKMREIKEDIELDELCDGLPKGFMTFIGYSRSLRFDEEPDYEYLRTILCSSAGRGAEAQIVRCYREPPPSLSRSQEQTYTGMGGLPIHRGGNDPYKSKERCKPDNPLKDWRNKPQYSPPSNKGNKNPKQRYCPASLWTTTPPDMAPKDERLGADAKEFQEMRDRIEWGVPPQDDTDVGIPLWGDEFNHNQIPNRPRKCSWGENDPNARWGHGEGYEDEPETEPDENLPFPMGSLHEDPAPIHTHYAKASFKPNTGTAAATAATSRLYKPQDARFYSDDPPAGLTPRLGDGSGFKQTLPMPIHPLSRPKDNDMYASHLSPPVPSSPKSLSSSFSSMNLRTGTHGEHPSTDRAQASSSIHSDKSKSNTIGLGRGRKFSNPQDRTRGWSVDHGTGAWNSSEHGKGRNGNENWQTRNADRRRPHGHGTVDSMGTSGPDLSHQGQHHTLPRTRQISASGTKAQGQGSGQLSIQISKQGHSGGYNNHGQSHGSHYYQHHLPHGQTINQNHRNQGSTNNGDGAFGFNEQGRQLRSRIRKSSNTSLSSLSDQWATNSKVGNNSVRNKPK